MNAPKPLPSARGKADRQERDDDPTSAMALQRWAHPDLHIVTKELARFDREKSIRDRKLTNIPVEVLRQHLLWPVYRSAQLEHGKVFIVDEAELMDLVGQNLLLKTLEEPPAQRYFILVTAQEDKLLATIRSRSQRIPFAALDAGIIANWLQAQPGTEKFTPTQQQWLIDFSAGSLGRLELALQYNLVTWARDLLPMLEEAQRGTFPTELGATFARLIDEFAQTLVDESGKTASKEAANRQGAALLFTLLTQWARKHLCLAADKAPAGDLIQLEAWLDPWLQVIDKVQQAESQLAANLNLGLLCDHLALHIFVELRRLPKEK